MELDKIVTNIFGANFLDDISQVISKQGDLENMFKVYLKMA